jgi:hypothetical protein
MGHWEDQGAEPSDSPCHLRTPDPDVRHRPCGIIFINICKNVAYGIDTKGAVVILVVDAIVVAAVAVADFCCC